MFKNHVGRPSNDELRSRRNKKILMIGLPIILVIIFVVLISSGSLSNLMGNSITSYECSDTSYHLDNDGVTCVKVITKNSAFYGDINLDDIIDNKDLNLLDSYVKDENSVSLTPLQRKVADVNDDGMISETDVQILEGHFTKIAGTYATYSEKIGVARLCEDGYTLNGVSCELRDTKPAIKKVVNINNDTTNNTNTINNNNSNNNNNQQNEKVETTTPSLEEKASENTPQQQDTLSNPVKVSFSPQNKDTAIKVYTKYNIRVVFDIKDTSRQYYYIWRNYTYGVNNFSTECKKVTQGRHSGNFTVDGTKRVNVTVYSDDKCQNQVTSVDSKKYTCIGCTNMVDAELKPQDSNTAFTNGTKYKMNINFKVNDKENTYYYIWSNYTNGNNNYNTDCTKVVDGEHYGSFTIDGNKKVSVAIYSDSSCKNKVKTVTSKDYTCTNCTPLKVVIGNNLSGSQKKGTVIHNGIRFNVYDNSKTYYYRWRTYNNGNLHAVGDCNKVTTDKEHVKDLTINNELQIRKGTITVYSDSSCTTTVNSVPVASTKEYKCNNCSPVTITIDKNLSSSQKKGNVIHNKVVFSVYDENKTYYYTWRAYGNGKQTYASNCEIVEPNRSIQKNLVISGTKPIYGIITVYSDSNCRYRLGNVAEASTTRYTCSNCNQSSNNSNSNTNSNNSKSNSSGSTSSKKSNSTSSKKKECEKVCPSNAESIGGECFIVTRKPVAKTYSENCPANQQFEVGGKKICGFISEKNGKREVIKTKDYQINSICPNGTTPSGNKCYKVTNYKHVNKVCAK